MKEVFIARRNRGSVTQGTATVLLNGQEVITFGDHITLIEGGQTRGAEYGEVINGWQSDKRDEDFIKGVTNPFYTNAEAIKRRIAEIIG